MLSDGTVVAKAAEEGVEFCVKDGNIFVLSHSKCFRYCMYLNYIRFQDVKVFCYRSSTASIDKGNKDNES